MSSLRRGLALVRFMAGAPAAKTAYRVSASSCGVPSSQAAQAFTPEAIYHGRSRRRNARRQGAYLCLRSEVRAAPPVLGANRRPTRFILHVDLNRRPISRASGWDVAIIVGAGARNGPATARSAPNRGSRGGFEAGSGLVASWRRGVMASQRGEADLGGADEGDATRSSIGAQRGGRHVDWDGDRAHHDGAQTRLPRWLIRRPTGAGRKGGASRVARTVRRGVVAREGGHDRSSAKGDSSEFEISGD